MAYQYKIQEITFSDLTTLRLPNLTVFVGPNNSGKSRALKDIVTLTCSTNTNVVVVRRVVPTFPPNAKELATAYDIAVAESTAKHTQFRFLEPALKQELSPGWGGLQWPEDFDQIFGDPNAFRAHFASQLTAMLTTESRLTLVSRSESAREPYQAANLLQVLYGSGSAKELEIRSIVSEAFPGIQLALDFSVPQRLEFKIGPDFSQLPPDPRDARPILGRCERLDEQGDGLRSYVAIAVALTTLKRPVFLIDEPEAFLHPPQAFRIGQFIATQASQGRQIIVATHSTDVLRGIVFKANDALIARIDRISDSNLVKPLDPEKLRDLINDPLLSAAGVLNGVFYSGVVVTEADADSRFYQAVSTKLGPALDIHFVNADNKQTVPKVLTTYKQLGIRCGGLVDIDVLDSGAEFNKQLIAAGIPEPELSEAREAQKKIDSEVRTTPAGYRLTMAAKRISEMKTAAEAALNREPTAQEAALENLRRELEKLKADASKWQDLKKNGAAALKSTSGEFTRLYELCGAAGLFINPSGELEASLSEYGVPWHADKRAWIAQALRLVGSLEIDLTKQPWKLVSDVHKHLQKAAKGKEETVVQTASAS